MTQPRYIPVPGTVRKSPVGNISSDGTQHLGNGAMWVTSSQDFLPTPVYVSGAPGTSQQPVGFMHHRSDMTINQQRPQPPPPLLLPTQAYNASFDPHTSFIASPSQTSFRPPHASSAGPFIEQPQSASLNVPSGIVAQTPIQHSPYGMALQPSPTGGPASAAILEPTGYGMKIQPTTSDNQLSRQQSTNVVYSSSDYSETPLSAAFPENLGSSYAPLEPQHDTAPPNQQLWTRTGPQGPSLPSGASQPSAYHPVEVQQGNQRNMQVQYLGQYQPNLVPVSQTFEAPQSMPVIYHYQPGPSLYTSAPSTPGTVPVYQPAVRQESGNAAGPFIAPQSAPPLSQSQRTNNRPAQVLDRLSDDPGSGWMQHGHSGTYVQYTGIPAGFTASHSQLPSSKTSGPMASDDGEEEEAYGTLAYDPYMVKHRKRTTPEQLVVLEKAFLEATKPTASARKTIAEMIGMTPRSVQVWFQNRRQKRKLQAKKTQEDGSSEAPASPPAFPSNSHPYVTGSSTAQGMSDGSSFSFAGSRRSSQTQVDRASARPRSAVYQVPYNGVPGAMKATPLIQQARRGSLPYPPPQGPGAQLAVQPPVMVRTVSSSGLARAPIPPHLANASTERRASLPLNAQSVSLGFFTPPRIGPRALGSMGTLAAITDDEHLQHYPKVGDVHDPASSAPVPAGNASGTHCQANPVVDQVCQNGPLPNPDFSFGNGASVARKASFTSSASVSPNVASPTFPHGFLYRNRMGSMASMLSQATTTDGTSDSEWERTQHLVTPYMLGNGDSVNVFVGLAPDLAMSSGVDQGLTLRNREDGFGPPNQLLLPPSNDGRRASAPAELLQKFAILDVEQQHQGQFQAMRKKSSPLNISFTGVNAENDSHSDSAIASPPALASGATLPAAVNEEMRSSVR